MNSDPPSTWMLLIGRGASAISLSSSALATAAVALVATWPVIHLATGFIGGEVLDGLVRPHVHKQRDDLHELAGPASLVPFGPAAGITLLCAAPDPSGCGIAAQGGHRDHDTLVHQPAQDAPNRGGRHGLALAAQHSAKLALSPHRIVGPQCLDGLNQRRRPERPAHSAGRVE